MMRAEIEAKEAMIRKGYSPALLGFALLLGNRLYAVDSARPEAVTASTVTGVVSVVSASNVGSNLTIRVAKYVESSLRVATRAKWGVLKAGLPLESVAGAVTNLLEPTDGVVLALVSVRSEGGAEKIMARGNVVVLDVEALMPKSLKAPDDVERYERRVERESMRAIGGLLGLSSCPNPTCALYRHRTEEELDQKGRNFCPPCSVRAMGILAQRGVQPVP